jgi:CheY-like chemotaxis protein
MLQKREQGQKAIILLVEDDVHIGTLLTEMIALGTPYQSVLVSDSLEALHVAREVKPILFLLDYHLPHMHGLALYDRLHAIEELAQVPAILVSAALPHRELEQRKLVGMSKPFSPAKVLGAIHHLLAHSQLTAEQ